MTPVVHMTYSAALAEFRTATPITAADLTSRHIDMVQMMDIDMQVRAALGPADDDVKASDRNTSAVRIVVGAYNKLCGGRP